MTERRRVLMCLPRFSQRFGGTPEACLLLAKELRRLDTEVDVIASNGLFESVADLEHLPDYSVRLPAPLLNLAHSFQCYCSVYISGPWNPIAAIVAGCCLAAGVKYVYSPKGGLAAGEFSRRRDLKKYLYFWLVERWVISGATYLLLSSKVERSAIRFRSVRNHPAVAVLPEPFNGLPDSRTECGHRNAASPTFRVGFLAEISPRKALRELVEGFRQFCSSFAAAHRRDADYQLVVGGSVRPGGAAYIRGIRELVADDSILRDRVIFLGPVRHEDRRLFYRSLDVFFAASHHESFGLTVLEALSCGVPVICSEMQGVLEYLPQSSSVFVLEALSPEHVAAGLRGVVSSLEEMTGAATYSSSALARFNGQKLAEQFVHIIG
jgi:glycosyltransferase involved in cell wall biosynthesis